MKRQRRGSTLVEASIVTTVFLILLCGIMQFGFVGFAYNSVCFAAHRAARYATIHGTASGHLAQASDIQNVALANITCLDTTALTVTVGSSNMNPGSTVQVTVAYKLQPFLIPVSTRTLTLQSTSTQTIVQ